MRFLEVSLLNDNQKTRVLIEFSGFNFKLVYLILFSPSKPFLFSNKNRNALVQRSGLVYRVQESKRGNAKTPTATVSVE